MESWPICGLETVPDTTAKAFADPRGEENTPPALQTHQPTHARRRRTHSQRTESPATDSRIAFIAPSRHRGTVPIHRGSQDAPPPYARAYVHGDLPGPTHSSAARDPGTHSPLSIQCSRLPAAGDAKCARASANAGRAERSGMCTIEPARSAMHEAAPVSVSPRAPTPTRSKKQRSDEMVYERAGSSWCSLISECGTVDMHHPRATVHSECASCVRVHGSPRSADPVWVPAGVCTHGAVPRRRWALARETGAVARQREGI